MISDGRGADWERSGILGWVHAAAAGHEPQQLGQVGRVPSHTSRVHPLSRSNSHLIGRRPSASDSHFRPRERGTSE